MAGMALGALFGATRSGSATITKVEAMEHRVALLETESTVNARAAVSLATKADEIDRRVAAVESNMVTRGDFLALSQRLDEIRQDIREIRNSMDRTPRG